jgi:hypothetical protein
VKYKYYFDGNLISDEPEGWQDYVTVIKLDRALNGILRTQEATISFTGDGYRYLKNLDDTVGWDRRVEVLITKSVDEGDNYRQFFKGIIFVAQVKWDDKRKKAKCKLQDDSYYSKINGNKNLECLLHIGKSKNGADIPVPEVWRTILHKVVDGSYVQGGHCYKIFEVLKYLVNFMTDGEVEFASGLFGWGGERSLTFLTVGKSIRKHATESVDEFKDAWKMLSWTKSLQELHRKLNLVWIIQRNASGKPVLRLEKDEYVSDHATDLFRAESVDELKTETDIERLYSAIKLGSTVTNETIGLNFPEDIQFAGFKIEDYIVAYKSNIDKILDLSTDWIVSSNVIEYIYANAGDETYDEKFVLLECEDYTPAITHFLGQALTRKTNWLTAAPPYYFNESFINQNVALRFLGGVPNSIAQYLTPAGTNQFRATDTNAYPFTFFASYSPDVSIEPLVQDDDSTTPNFDSGANYSIITSRFDAPAGGIYTFNGRRDFQFKNTSPGSRPNINVGLYLMVYDSGGTLLSTNELHYSPVLNVPESSTIGYSASGVKSVIMAAGDYARLKTTIHILATNPELSQWKLEYGLFECLDAVTGSGVFQVYDPNLYSVQLHDFDFKMTEAEWELIDSDPRGIIRFGRFQEVLRKGRIEELKRLHLGGMTKFKLHSSKILNP